MATKLKRLQQEILKTTQENLEKIGFDILIERVAIDCRNLESDSLYTFQYARKYSESPSIFLFSNMFSLSYGSTVEFKKLKPKLVKWNEKELTVRAPSVPKSMLSKGNGLAEGMVCYLAIGQGA